MASRCLPLLLLCLISGWSVAGEPVAWDKLIPQQADYHDPFLALSADQLADLGYYAGLGQRIQRLVIAEVDDTAVAELRKEQAMLARDLAKEGVDVNYLLGERERVMAARQTAATSRSAELLGSEVILHGYLIPLNKDISRFYLVEHSPLLVIGHDHSAPPPNQVVGLTLEEPIEFDAGQRMTFSGVLEAADSQTTVIMPDGHPRELISVYRLNDAVAIAQGDRDERGDPLSREKKRP